MSKRRRTNYPNPKSASLEAVKQQEITQPEKLVVEPEFITPSEVNRDGITFAQVSNRLPLLMMSEVISKAIEESKKYRSQIDEVFSSTNLLKPTNSSDIINYIESLIDAKESILRFLSWSSVIVSIVQHLVIDSDEEMDNKWTNAIENFLIEAQNALDTLLTRMSKEPILGITLAPDQKQISETKATIADVISRLEKIKQENEEAARDWGIVEENAYLRMTEGSINNIPGEQFLDWLSELEQGNDV